MDNPMPALARLVQLMKDALAESTEGATWVDHAFKAAETVEGREYPDMMHVTFILDPALAFTTPEERLEQDFMDGELAGIEAASRAADRAEKEAALAKEAQELHQGLVNRIKDRKPRDGIGLED